MEGKQLEEVEKFSYFGDFIKARSAVEAELVSN